MKKSFAFLLFLLLWAVPAWANPPSIVSVTATAKGDVQRPVVINVKVTNRGKEPSEPAGIVVTCTPAGRGGGGKTLKDPLDLKQVVGPLKPGETQEITLNTPYESRNSFTNQRGTFRAYNIDPTREIVVSFKGVVTAAPQR